MHDDWLGLSGMKDSFMGLRSSGSWFLGCGLMSAV
jgi:hypothetical protein